MQKNAPKYILSVLFVVEQRFFKKKPRMLGKQIYLCYLGGIREGKIIKSSRCKAENLNKMTF